MNEKPQKKIDGYYDTKRDVFVVTKDIDKKLSPIIEENPAEEIDREKMKLLFKKYKPTWMK